MFPSETERRIHTTKRRVGIQCDKAIEALAQRVPVRGSVRAYVQNRGGSFISHRGCQQHQSTIGLEAERYLQLLGDVKLGWITQGHMHPLRLNATDVADTLLAWHRNHPTTRCWIEPL